MIRYHVFTNILDLFKINSIYNLWMSNQSKLHNYKETAVVTIRLHETVHSI